MLRDLYCMFDYFVDPGIIGLIPAVAKYIN